MAQWQQRKQPAGGGKQPAGGGKPQKGKKEFTLEADEMHLNQQCFAHSTSQAQPYSLVRAARNPPTWPAFEVRQIVAHSCNSLLWPSHPIASIDNRSKIDRHCLNS